MTSNTRNIVQIAGQAIALRDESGVVAAGSPGFAPAGVWRLCSYASASENEASARGGAAAYPSTRRGDLTDGRPQAARLELQPGPRRSGGPGRRWVAGG